MSWKKALISGFESLLDLGGTRFEHKHKKIIEKTTQEAFEEDAEAIRGDFDKAIQDIFGEDNFIEDYSKKLVMNRIETIDEFILKNNLDKNDMTIISNLFDTDQELFLKGELIATIKETKETKDGSIINKVEIIPIKD